jgi:glycerate dehydrogenase
MKIIVLDEYTLNPGELSWESFEAIRNITIYKRTPSKKIFKKIFFN